MKSASRKLKAFHPGFSLGADEGPIRAVNCTGHVGWGLSVHDDRTWKQ
jgi:hypothetical protein